MSTLGIHFTSSRALGTCGTPLLSANTPPRGDTCYPLTLIILLMNDCMIYIYIYMYNRGRERERERESI